MKELKFYICDTCGNLIEIIHGSGVTPVCCNNEMRELVPGTVEASHEKHIPVCGSDGRTVTVKVGSAEHPMLPEHFIQWICLQTEKGAQRIMLAPGQKPEAVFVLGPEDKPVAAYAYCNLHGLWKAEA